jgi:hypothetical protein
MEDGIMPLKRARKRSGALKRPKQASVASLKKKAWKLLSQCIRQEQAINNGGDCKCYTCDSWDHAKSMQAGHAIGGRNGAVLLDEEIIRPQCVRCNIMLRGNYSAFVPKLIRERAESLPVPHGDTGDHFKEAHEWWEAKLASSKQVRKWSRVELQEKIDSYNARLELMTKA